MAKREKKEKQPKTEKYQYEHSSARIGKQVAAVENKRRISIVLVALLLIALFITGIIYAVLYFVETNSFKIGIEESSIGGLSLADEYTFQYPMTYLSMGGPDKMDNTTYKLLDLQHIFSTDGSSNGKNYIAFTFYVKNDGTASVNFRTEITIESESKNIADALRVLVRQADPETGFSEITYYARKNADGEKEKLVPYFFNPIDDNDLEILYDEETRSCYKGESRTADIETEPFKEDNPNGRSVIMSQVHENLAPNRPQAFTVVVWLEGEDKECVDGILGGKMRLEMKLSVADGNDGSISVD